MKQVIVFITFLGLLIFQACTSRQDKVFSAFDELHYIILYEEGSEFELQYNGVNTAKGTYALNNDTIKLTYSVDQIEEFDPNEKLTRKILIDEENRRVKSIDTKMQFCANIDIDERKIKN